MLASVVRGGKREIVNIGFIGLGAMGLPMAKRVVAAGYKTYSTFHRRREPAEELRALGAEIKPTPRDVAASAEVIVTILPADAELRETVFSPQGILAGFSSGKVLVEMTSGTAMAMQEVEQAIRGLGGRAGDVQSGIGGTGGVVGGANGLGTHGAQGLAGVSGIGIGGGVFTVAPGMAIIVNTLIAGNFASTSNPDVFGTIITVI